MPSSAVLSLVCSTTPTTVDRSDRRRERAAVGRRAGRVCLENVIGIVTRGPTVGFLMSRTCGAFGIFVSLPSKK